MLAAMLTMDTTPHHVAGAGAEQPIGDDVEDAAFHGGKLPDRQHVQEQQVQQEVDCDDRERAEGQRARNVPARVRDLFGDVRRGVPPRVGEHHRNEREQPGAARDRTAALTEIRRRPRTEREAERDEEQQRGHLESGQQVA